MQRSVLLLIATVLLTSNELVPSIARSIVTADDNSSSVRNSTSTFFNLDLLTIEESRRFQREIESGSQLSTERSSSNNKCSVRSYEPANEIGHQATCPFDFVLDVDAERIPEKIFEQVCRGCPSCGPHRTCTQLTLLYEVNYRKTINETSRLVIRSGCICLPLGVGSRAFSFDI